MGLTTSLKKDWWLIISPNLSCSNSWTVPGYLGAIVWGLYDIAISGISKEVLSGRNFLFPESILTNVVFPVPFSPNKTIISQLEKQPSSTLSSKVPNFLSISGYLNKCSSFFFSITSVLSDILKDKLKSLNLIFSVGIKPSKNTLIPSLTPYGRVTTPYAAATPYNTHIVSDK